MEEPWLHRAAPGLKVQVLALVIMCAGAVAYLGLKVYGLLTLVMSFPLSAAYNTRWKLNDGAVEEDSRKIFYMAISWPLTVILLPKIIIREERARKRRIVREVMES